MFPELVTRPDLQVFLPPIGGTTIYLFGDVAKLADPRDARSPAACTTSATAPTCSAPTSAPAGPISCTASRNARAARRSGGLGIIVYNRKEGRALGEVTKFLVYNARKRQEGGDAASAYFERTECVAGVQDARFQQLMPDVMHWLGITRIDRFVSMSDMKYDALVGQGVEIVERVPIPDELVPADAHVEMEAKKAAGYFTPSAASRRTRPTRSAARSTNTERRLAPHVSRMSAETAAALSLLSAAAVRERAQRMLALGLDDKLPHFRVDLAALDDAADLVVATTRKNYPTLDVPFHSRWRHFVVDGATAGPKSLTATAWRDATRTGARRIRSRHRQRAARRRRRAAMALSRCRERAKASAAPRGWRSRASTCSRTALSRRDPDDPLRADAAALARVDTATLGHGFQVGPAIRWSASKAAPSCCAGWANVACRDRRFSPRKTAASRRLVRSSRCAWPTSGAIPAPLILSELLLQSRADLAVAAYARRRAARRLLAASGS